MAPFYSFLTIYELYHFSIYFYVFDLLLLLLCVKILPSIFSMIYMGEHNILYDYRDKYFKKQNKTV